jgi:hypothetical protein
MTVDKVRTNRVVSLFHWVASFAIVLIAFVLAPIGAHAASSASLHLQVNDEKGTAIPGALVESTFQGKALSTASTDDKGSVTIIPQTAGQVDLTISKSGFVTSQTSINVPSASTPTQVDVVLTQSSLSKQQIEVTATGSEATTETSSRASTIAPAQAKQTPTKPATLIDALPLVPGVTRATDGSVQIAGYGQTHSALLVNSVNVTDPATGDFGLSVPIDSVETISVSEMPYLAQYGKFTAGVVAADTRRGGEKWDYSLNDPLPDFRIRSGHLVGVRDTSWKAENTCSTSVRSARFLIHQMKPSRKHSIPLRS